MGDHSTPEGVRASLIGDYVRPFVRAEGVEPDEVPDAVYDLLHDAIGAFLDWRLEGILPVPPSKY